MSVPPTTAPRPTRATGLVVPIVLVVAVFGCTVYANLSFAVSRPADYRWFPPFDRNTNANHNRGLGAEYFNIARSLVRGQGYANPFFDQTGPTAWMPPVYPVLLAGLLWACDDEPDAVMVVILFLQTCVLAGTGLLVLALARPKPWLGAAASAVVFFVFLLSNFHLYFQSTHDCWVVLLALDLVVAGLCWWRPLDGRKTAVGWGLVGGFCAQMSPVAGFAWGMSSLVLAWRQRAWSRFGVAVLAGGLALAPWTIRNYAVFGRLVPVKSNAAYELYQSQCLQPDGLLHRTTFRTHPYASPGRERQQYRALGEMAFLDRKRELFRQAVAADPLDFLDRAACRFLGATLWYEPMDPAWEARHPWSLWYSRLTHPLPFLGLLLLVLATAWQPLHRFQWVGIGVYLFYLLPYIAISYYERYAVPLLGVKVLLVLWAADRLRTLAFGPRAQAGGREVRRRPADTLRRSRRPEKNGRAACPASASFSGTDK